MHRTFSRTRGALAGALLLSLALVPAVPASAAPTQVKPGFNLFSAQQDVEVGRKSAQQAERQLPLLNDRQVEGYVDSVFRRLVAQAPGDKFPYQVRVVNAKDINAFALPGGFVYLNRGTIQAAQTEGQLAGVLAHEISHVALRHGTHNASKSYVTQAGLGVLSYEEQAENWRGAIAKIRVIVQRWGIEFPAMPELDIEGVDVSDDISAEDIIPVF